MRLIDADALKKAIEKYRPQSKVKSLFLDGEHCMFMDCISEINNAPTIIWCNQTSDGLPLFDLRERPQGEWVKADSLYDTVVCNKCGGIRRDNRIDHIAFCNKCGAEMRGEDK